ncbi:hydroxypyruvate isomerase family protein [Cellulophaga sp. BC115SP]|uniref:hydroxypyruvate isomerase family protein n=1 Tax=Cellulophaga sp. BC115SP TaxID=2683263 RepID=UPI001411BB98|nr:TIM barrel protein [Cellulophaga sp. BC115SP]NBB27597.1 TIM barrel protein [Cellulophaga sp. BC115SP]
MENPISRRSVLQKTLAATTATMLTSSLNNRIEAADNHIGSALKGRINHSACRWCYESVPFEDLCKSAKEIGMKSIELTGPEEWSIMKKYDLTAGMGWGSWPKGTGLTNFFNDPQNHDLLANYYIDYLIPEAAKAGIKNLICFSGNRNGISETQGLLNCKKVIQRIIKTAEKHDVTLSMELLNSKVNHRDYQCDHTEWGVELCEMVGSEKFKLLYDIYHMQIMEGDVIATIKKYNEYISHYHTGGVPGRHEINDSQELNYPAIMKAIVDTGYKGFIGQEFIPTRTDKIASLREGILICDI